MNSHDLRSLPRLSTFHECLTMTLGNDSWHGIDGVVRGLFLPCQWLGAGLPLSPFWAASSEAPRCVFGGEDRPGALKHQEARELGRRPLRTCDLDVRELLVGDGIFFCAAPWLLTTCRPAVDRNTRIMHKKKGRHCILMSLPASDVIRQPQNGVSFPGLSGSISCRTASVACVLSLATMPPSTWSPRGADL